MNESMYANVADEAEERKKRAAEGVDSLVEQAIEHEEHAMAEARQLVDQVRARVESMPGTEKASEVVHGAADRLKKTAGYVRDRNRSSRRDTALSMLKSRPAVIVMVVLAAGLLLGRVLRSQEPVERCTTSGIAIVASALAPGALMQAPRRLP